MNTSYFAKNAKNLNAISIAGKSPDWYTGREYKALAPKYEWWIKWKTEGLSEQWYIEQYYKTVLRHLNPQQVYNELGENAILLCWEGPDKFCHRHLIAKWFKATLGIEVKEI